MDAVKFLEELRRMCRSEKYCADCPLKVDSFNHCNFWDNPHLWTFTDVSKDVAIVEKWSAEHPVKTRLMDFLENYPNARLMEGTRMPFLTPDVLGYCGMSRCKSCEHERYTMAHCWNLPLEE